jgi:hypothetical protein
MKHLQLIASHQTLEKYIKEHNNLKLDKFINLYTYPEFQNNIIESFDKLYFNTEYKIYDYIFNDEYSNYKNHNGYQIFFETDSKTEYRIDLIPVINYNKNINSDFVWSLSFTLKKYDINSEDYEKLTELYEEKEVLIRVGDILNQLDIEKYFVIGKTIDPRKLNLYKNVLLYVFKNYNIDFNYCEGMIDNKGLYAWI